MAIWKRRERDPDPAGVAVGLVAGASVLGAFTISAIEGYTLLQTLLIAVCATAGVIGLFGVLSPTLMRWRTTVPGLVLLITATVCGIAAFLVL